MKRLRFTSITLALIFLMFLSAAGYPAQEEPVLPEGLEPKAASPEEPALPPGLGSSPPSQREDIQPPALPPGLGEENPAPAAPGQEPFQALNLPFELSGFLDGRIGTRIHGDPYEETLCLEETRLQVQAEKNWIHLGMKLTADFLYDGIVDQTGIHLETGAGYVDLRDANVSVTPASFMDIKAGRQILTWGVGDLIFINDLFPKDYVSFFIGRDVEYLKAPSDAFKISFFGQQVNVNLVYTPRFDPDRFITGSRLSYYSPTLGRTAGRDAIIRTETPDRWFKDDEIALRLYRNLRGYELALYGYRGFWKSPAGTDPKTGRAVFPELGVYGASARGKFLKGIASIEIGHYDSAENRAGDNPFIKNSEFRLLLGYEQELARNFTAGMQYYIEHIINYGEYLESLPWGTPQRDENRQVLTLRLSQLLMSQNLSLSLFTFYSPSDRDGYVRPNAHYKINDHWSTELGGNVFFGDRASSFFGQFEIDSNVYSSLRISF